MSRFSVVTQTGFHPLHLVRPCDTCMAREYSACAPLSADDQRRLVTIMRTLEIAAHQPVFEEGEPAENVYNVTAGAMKIYKLLPDGRRQITGFLFPGDFLGLMHNDSYAYSAEALTRTSLCRFPRRQFEALLDQLPRLEQRLLGMASHELAAAQDQMVLLGRKSARERVVSFLVMLSDTAVRRGQPGNPVSLPMTRTDIADYLGLTIETVSRTLSKLKAERLIEPLGEREIQIAQMAEMRQIAGKY